MLESIALWSDYLDCLNSKCQDSRRRFKIFLHFDSATICGLKSVKMSRDSWGSWRGFGNISIADRCQQNRNEMSLRRSINILLILLTRLTTAISFSLARDRMRIEICETGESKLEEIKKYKNMWLHIRYSTSQPQLFNCGDAFCLLKNTTSWGSVFAYRFPKNHQKKNKNIFKYETASHPWPWESRWNFIADTFSSTCESVRLIGSMAHVCASFKNTNFSCMVTFWYFSFWQSLPPCWVVKHRFSFKRISIYKSGLFINYYYLLFIIIIIYSLTNLIIYNYNYLSLTSTDSMSWRA